MPYKALSFAAAATRAKRGVVEVRPVVSGIVEAGNRSVGVELGLIVTEERPARFCVTFPTANSPMGIVYEIDVTDLLENLVRSYFDVHPEDAPISLTR